MTAAAAGERTRYDYKVKVESAFNSGHKAPPPPRCVLSKQPPSAFFNAKFIETDYVTRDNGE